MRTLHIEYRTIPEFKQSCAEWKDLSLLETVDIVRADEFPDLVRRSYELSNAEAGILLNRKKRLNGDGIIPDDSFLLLTVQSS